RLRAEPHVPERVQGVTSPPPEGPGRTSPAPDERNTRAPRRRARDIRPLGAAQRHNGRGLRHECDVLPPTEPGRSPTVSPGIRWFSTVIPPYPITNLLRSDSDFQDHRGVEPYGQDHWNRPRYHQLVHGRARGWGADGHRE